MAGRRCNIIVRIAVVIVVHITNNYDKIMRNTNSNDIEFWLQVQRYT